MNTVITIGIVNFNAGSDTKNLLDDLSKQNNKNFEVWLYDQNSEDELSKKLFSSSEYPFIVKKIQNGFNKPLNHIWNEIASINHNKLTCFLNNDIRITNNYIDDTIKAFNNKDVKIAIHATNNIKFLKATAFKDLVMRKQPIKHGWEFTCLTNWLKESPINQELKFYCGDDWIFDRLYSRGEFLSYIFSSPVLHSTSKTTRIELNLKQINPNILLKTDADYYQYVLGKRIFLKAQDSFSNIFMNDNEKYILEDYK